jgi:hypothetical protein
MNMFRIGLAVVLCGFLAAQAPAQFWKPKIKLDGSNVQVGFRSVGVTSDYGSVSVAKVGMWAPVYFTLEYADETRVPMKVVLKMMDGDGYSMECSYPIVDGIPEGIDPPAKGGKIEKTELTHTVYARVGGENSTIGMTIYSDDGKDTRLSDTVQVNPGGGPKQLSKYTILSLGTKLPNFTFKARDGDSDKTEMREDRFLFARCDSVEELPDNWFGYESIDLVVLTTGKADKQFLETLFTGAKAERKRRALFEWVRRGGKLVVSAATNAELVRASADFAKVLPMTVGEVNREPSLQLFQDETQQSWLELKFKERPAPRPAQLAVVSGVGGVVLPDLMPITQIKPGAMPYTTLLSEAGGKKRPLMVQAPLGLGRITFVAFDLDRSPFVDHPQRGEFWDWFIPNVGTAVPEGTKNKNNDGGGFNASVTGVGAEDGAAAALRKNTDTFEGVPVISFGWVALFILIYTAIIGPLEYIILKKVFGKLELTWITFPIIVLSVSAAAYFTAYAVKGKDLRINKIDIVDVDMRAAQPRVYGRTWFTIFSPRIDNYTLAVEPKEGWGNATDENGFSPVSTVDWFGQTVQASNLTGGGSGRSYKAAINPLGDDRRALDITGNARNLNYANGLEGVPIQVWSTKAFTANWSSLVDVNSPIVTSTLRHLPQKDAQGLPDGVEGRITFKIPLAEVQEAYAFYRGKAYKFQTGLAPDVAVPFSMNTTDLVRPEDFLIPDERFYEVDNTDVVMNPGSNRNRGQTVSRTTTRSSTGASAPLNFFGYLFHDKAVGKVRQTQNASLRVLDQSWRLNERNVDEVIVVLKLRRASGAPEDLMTKPEGASPSKLWLKGLPGRDTRSGVEGVLQQETMIRVYLPVKPSGAK